MKHYYVEHPNRTRIRQLCVAPGGELLIDVSVTVESSESGFQDEQTARNLSREAARLLCDKLNAELGAQK